MPSHDSLGPKVQSKMKQDTFISTANGNPLFHSTAEACQVHTVVSHPLKQLCSKAQLGCDPEHPENSQRVSQACHTTRTLYKCLKASLSQRNQSRRIIKHGFLPKQDAITNLLCISMDPWTKKINLLLLLLLLLAIYLLCFAFASHLLRIFT